MAKPIQADLDYRAFLNGLERKFDNLRHNADREALRLAEETAERMKALVPRDTGETADSIEAHRTGEGEAEVTIGGAGLYQEFGTSKMSPQPFARPALAEAPRRFKPPDFR